MAFSIENKYSHNMNNTSSLSDNYATTMTQVTPNMVRTRTVELALKAGRSALEIRKIDYERAKRELTGEKDFDRQLAVLYAGV